MKGESPLSDARPSEPLSMTAKVAKPGVPAWYVYTVGLLLLAILASLLAMTLVYRRRALLAEAELDRQRNARQAMIDVLGQSMAPRLQRAQLRQAEITLNDQPTQALIVEPLRGEAIGLRTGDVLIVAEIRQPTTAAAPSGP